MAILRIEKFFTSGNQAVYVLRTPVLNPGIAKLLEALPRGREHDFSGVDFYNAVRGHLDEKGLAYGQQGELPVTAVMRLNDPNSVSGLDKLLKEAQNYAAIEQRAHSKADDEKLDEFRRNLARLASKYK